MLGALSNLSQEICCLNNILYYWNAFGTMCGIDGTLYHQRVRQRIHFASIT